MTLRLLTRCLVWTSLNLSSQTSLTKDSFFLNQNKFPQDYKTIVGDQRGWRGIGYYNVYRDKFELKLHPWDTLSVYTPFKDGTMFLKIRGSKIIGKGDKRSVAKILYVDSLTLILERKWTEKTHGKRKRVKVRTLYRRKT